MTNYMKTLRGKGKDFILNDVSSSKCVPLDELIFVKRIQRLKLKKFPYPLTNEKEKSSPHVGSFQKCSLIKQFKFMELLFTRKTF